MKQGISVCMILYNEGDTIRDSLESVKEIADEILIVHDGPCKNNTLDICKEYTKNIFVREHKGICEYHQAFLYRKAKYNWILKIDADESLSKPLQKNIRKLIKNPSADAYSFIWPYWDGKKEITFGWPKKVTLYRKDKISYLGFANWGEPTINGKTISTNYKIEHHPSRGDPTTWLTFKNRDLRFALLWQAKDAVRNFEDFDRFQYQGSTFPKKLLIRLKYPLLSAPFLGIAASLKTLFSKAIFKNIKIILKTSLYAFIRSFYYGGYIYHLQKNPNWKRKD